MSTDNRRTMVGRAIRRVGGAAARVRASDTFRVLPVLAPVCLGGAAVVAASLWALGSAPPRLGVTGGLLVLLAAGVLAEANPVPVESFPAGTISLAAVFVLGADLLYGWAPGVVVAFLTRGLVDLIQRRGAMRFIFNGSLYALSSAAAAGLASLVSHDHAVGWLLLKVLLAAGGFYAVNIPLVVGMVALWARERFLPMLRRWVLWTLASFAIMASISLTLDALWRQSPVLAVGLGGPLIAVGLYQRSMHEALKAMRLALTDPLTGLGNNRHFQERLEDELESARGSALPVTVCLIDLDNYKQINDRFGHPAGDRVLMRVAESLGEGGEAFRLGGDEFALLLPGRDDEQGRAIAQQAVERLASDEYGHGGTVGFSVGVATYPQHAPDCSELVRVADMALYWAKGAGKNRVHVFRPDMPVLADLRELRDGPERPAQLRAAASLARAVDARDSYVGNHSARVGRLAALIAARLGLPADQVELVQLAGRLHDLGKLGVPEEILRKPGALTSAEREVLERHPTIGFQMLQSLDVEPVASWVLHHHERWDGEGYPDKLAGERIPVGARILSVAESYDAMTTNRVPTQRLSTHDAALEIERRAGTQFDPAVVAAFLEEIRDSQHLRLAAAS